jgi:hydroxymethylglutaryl-CoA synthase
VEEYIQERKNKGVWAADLVKIGMASPETMRFDDQKSYEKYRVAFLKAVSESAPYKRFIKEKLEKAQHASQETGNLYTASIFLALMSTLEADVLENSKISGKRFGFVAYGSGSKAKVFEGVVQKEWANVARQFQIAEKLKRRQAIDYDQYEALHTGSQATPILAEKGRWGLKRIGQEGVTLGARYYAEF